MTRRAWAVLATAVALAACSGSGQRASSPSVDGTAAASTIATAPSTTGSPTGSAPSPITAAPGEATTGAPGTATAAATSAPTASGESGSAPATTAAGPTAPPTPLPAPPLLAGLAGDPVGLAGQLADALHTIHDPGADDAAVAAAGRRQQLVVRRLAAHPDWQADVLAALPDDVRAFATGDVAAANAPGDATLARPVPPLDTMPRWLIRTPLPATELLGYYKQAEATTGIGWTYLAAINFVETRMGRIAGLSTAGAVGPMQFLPSTWAVCCTGDPTVDRDAIMGAAVYLQRRGGPADMSRAILGYNPNEAYLRMITSYATNMAADERTYLGYHAWQVYVSTAAGPVRLPEGTRIDTPTAAADYVAAHPEDRA